jgi:hypothetical protein
LASGRAVMMMEELAGIERAIVREVDLISI